jgi:hypothetical protein
LGLLGLVFWALFLPHTTQTDGPISLAEAEECPIPLPDSAARIQFYDWFMLNLFQEYVKFEAPAEDCRAHVDVVLREWREVFDNLDKPYGPPEPVDPHPLSRTSPHPSAPAWFDPQTIQTGLHYRGHGSGYPDIWIDTQRGIFYYQLTD